MSLRVAPPFASFASVTAIAAGLAAFACGTTTEQVVVAPATTPPATECAEGEVLDPDSATCIAAAVTPSALGSGDGPGSVTLTEIYAATKSASLVDLAFMEKDPTQVWVIGYGDDSVHIGTGVTGDAKGAWKEYLDPAARHFMHKPPAIATGADGFWGICGDNDNSQNDPRKEPNYFMGPALFTSNLEVFAEPTEGGLGSHYDMLHNTSLCRGIAWEEANVFWAFNGQLGSIDKNDFAKDHGPGADDHSDGKIYRYVEGQVKGVDGVSSHLVFDPTDKVLYIADTGNKRIAKLDTTAGTAGARLPLRNEPLAKSAVMKNTTTEDVVPAGTLEQPSGIEIKDGILYVTDAATSTFYAFDKTGKELRKLETGLAPGSLSGFVFGPDGKIFFTDRKRGKVLRIDPIVE